jgi:FkbM family methyltransferase
MKILPNDIAVIDGDTHISRWVEETGRLDHDQNTLPLLTKYIPHGGTVIDVGAFIGDHTLHYANCVGITGSVVAMEPNPIAFACLKHNMAEHKHVTCLNVGASHLPVNIAIYGDANAGASRARNDINGTIATIAIDSLNLSRCDFMKLDCEGWELWALKGARNTIRKHKPVMLIEINEGALKAQQGLLPSHIFSFLEECGYEYRNIYEGQPMEGPQYDILAWSTR